MRSLETGKDKVKKICEVLKKETLDPAKQQAEELVASANRQADEILAKAQHKAEKMIENTRLEIERQKEIFQASISQACLQTLEMLKEKIEDKLFNPQLHKLIAAPLQNTQVIAQMITAVIKAIDKEGIEVDLSAYIASTVNPQEVNELLASEIIQRLREKSVLLSSIGGGIEVKLIQDNLTIDLSDLALKEMVASYIRKAFREIVFRE